MAPFDVVLAGDKAYVSNWGGRRPDSGDLTGPAGRGMIVRVDPVRHIANEGSVSVIDLGDIAGVPQCEFLLDCTLPPWRCHPTGVMWSSPMPPAIR